MCAYLLLAYRMGWQQLRQRIHAGAKKQVELLLWLLHSLSRLHTLRRRHLSAPAGSARLAVDHLRVKRSCMYARPSCIAFTASALPPIPGSWAAACPERDQLFMLTAWRCYTAPVGCSVLVQSFCTTLMPHPRQLPVKTKQHQYATRRLIAISWLPVRIRYAQTG